MARRLGPLQRILLIVVPLVLLIGAVEGVQRVRYAVRQNDWRWLAYGFVDRYGGDAPGVTNVIRVTDNVVAELSRVDERHRYIACVGGSATKGIYNDDAHRFPYLLERLIDERRPDRYVVLNLGKGGSASEHYARVLDQALGTTTPVLVVFYSGYNDLFINQVNRLYRTVMAHSLAWLEGRSLVALTAHEKYLIANANRPGALLTPDRLAEIQDDFRRHMAVNVATLRRRGVRVLLVPEVVMARRFGPTRSYEHYEGIYAPMRRILGDVAAAQGVELLDLQPDFEREDFRLNFVDPVHLTDRGNAVLARLIFERSRTVREVVDAP